MHEQAGYGQLLDELSRVRALRNPKTRGRAFEQLLRRVFERASYEVRYDPRAASPRQSDLLVRRGDEYLLEARWRAKPAGSGDVDALRSRLDRLPATVLGVLVSMAGFTAGARGVVRQSRQRPVLLLDGGDIERVIAGPTGIHALLRRRRRALLEQAEVVFGSDSVSKLNLDDRSLPDAASRLGLATDAASSWMISRGDPGPLVFAGDLPDVDWTTAQGHGVGLDLDLPIQSEADLRNLVEVLRRSNWLTADGTFSIAQTTASWHGFGMRDLLQALRRRTERYRSLDKIHHSEEAVYFDRCPGGSYSLHLSIKAGGAIDVHDAQLSSQLTGMPLDVAPYRSLIETFDLDEEAFFRPLEQSNRRANLVHHDVDLEVVDYICPNGRQTVRGIVARNPFAAGRLHRSLLPEGLHSLAQAELVICRLRSWHDPEVATGGYFLWSWEWLWTADALVVDLVADWRDPVASPSRQDSGAGVGAGH